MTQGRCTSLTELSISCRHDDQPSWPLIGLLASLSGSDQALQIRSRVDMDPYGFARISRGHTATLIHLMEMLAARHIHETQHGLARIR